MGRRGVWKDWEYGEGCGKHMSVRTDNVTLSGTRKASTSVIVAPRVNPTFHTVMNLGLVAPTAGWSMAAN